MSEHELPSEEHGTFRYFGRRRGKPLRNARAALLETLLPKIRLPRPAPGEMFDVPALFPKQKQRFWLEIGFGGGEHLAAQACANPDINFIGCEVFLNGIGSLLKHVEQDGTADDIRVFPDDARQIMPAFPDGIFERIFLLFPDPWPKKRHAERRFVSQENLDVLARLLKDGGEFRVASDDLNYIEWAIAQGAQHPDFILKGETMENCRQRPADWMPTRYEEKALKQGKVCHYLSFTRQPKTPIKIVSQS